MHRWVKYPDIAFLIYLNGKNIFKVHRNYVFQTILLYSLLLGLSAVQCEFIPPTFFDTVKISRPEVARGQSPAEHGKEPAAKNVPDEGPKPGGGQPRYEHFRSKDEGGGGPRLVKVRRKARRFPRRPYGASYSPPPSAAGKPTRPAEEGYAAPGQAAYAAGVQALVDAYTSPEPPVSPGAPADTYATPQPGQGARGRGQQQRSPTASGAVPRYSSPSTHPPPSTAVPVYTAPRRPTTPYGAPPPRQGQRDGGQSAYRPTVQGQSWALAVFFYFFTNDFLHFLSS